MPYNKAPSVAQEPGVCLCVCASAYVLKHMSVYYSCVFGLSELSNFHNIYLSEDIYYFSAVFSF